MENLNQIESEILKKIGNAKDRNAYETIKSDIFGKKGIITDLFKKIGNLDQDQRKDYASKLNSLKLKVTEILEKLIKNNTRSKAARCNYAYNNNFSYSWDSKKYFEYSQEFKNFFPKYNCKKISELNY